MSVLPPLARRRSGGRQKARRKQGQEAGRKLGVGLQHDIKGPMAATASAPMPPQCYKQQQLFGPQGSKRAFDLGCLLFMSTGFKPRYTVRLGLAQY